MARHDPLHGRLERLAIDAPRELQSSKAAARVGGAVLPEQIRLKRRERQRGRVQFAEIYRGPWPAEKAEPSFGVRTKTRRRPIKVAGSERKFAQLM